MALIRRSAASLAALADRGSVAELMFEQTLYGLGVRPSPGEARSWERSIPVLAHDLAQAGLGDVEVLLEYRLPLSSRRIDAILAGAHPVTGAPSYLIVELKQWSDADLYEHDPALVTVGGYGHRPRLHPLEQVRGYCECLIDFSACAEWRHGHHFRSGVPAQCHRAWRGTVILLDQQRLAFNLVLHATEAARAGDSKR